jgi:hypothetical protein
MFGGWDSQSPIAAGATHRQSHHRLKQQHRCRLVAAAAASAVWCGRQNNGPRNLRVLVPVRRRRHRHILMLRSFEGVWDCLQSAQLEQRQSGVVTLLWCGGTGCLWLLAE